MVGLVLLMRYTRTSNGSGDLYLSSTAVFCMEVNSVVGVNLLRCIAKFFYENFVLIVFLSSFCRNDNIQLTGD